MKYLLKSPQLIVFFIIIFIIGCFIGYNISTDFSRLYISTLMLPIIRYSLLVLVVSINFLVFSLLSGSVIVLRKKSLFSSLMYITKIEIFILLILFVILHLPILFLNISQSLEHLDLIIKSIINCILVSLFLFSLIKLIDVRIKNRITACEIFLSCFCIMDFLLEHFNWFGNNDPIFDFSYIFVLPFIYKNYFVMFLILTITGLFLTSLNVFLGIKKDFFLGSDSYDERD